MISQCFQMRVIFSVDIDIQYLTFKICYDTFQDKLSIGEHCTHNNEQFGRCLGKIKQILIILQGILKSL